MTTKIGFIGTGGIASIHLQNISKIEGATVSAVCDIVQERAEQAAAQWPDAKAYTQIASMLDDRKLDAVYICIPPMAHGEAEESVISRGLPFLVEKPLGITLEQPRRFAEQVRKQNLTTAVGYHWRYMDSIDKVKQILADSKPGMALGYWMGGMPMVPWWRKQDGSGGQFVEQTTHIVDLVRYLCGEIEEVYAAFALRAMHEQVEGTTVPDVGTVTAKLANGMVASISNTCLLPIGHRVGLDIFTDRGVVEIQPDWLHFLSPEPLESVDHINNPYLAEDEAFIHAVRTGDRSKIRADYNDALKTHEVTIGANESARTGKPVRLA